VVVPHVNASVQDTGRLIFHMVGDTGGIYGPDLQEAIAAEMEHQITKAGPGDKPAFL
jgi:hypothetical protein